MKDKFDVSHMLSKGWRAEAAKEWSGTKGPEKLPPGHWHMQSAPVASANRSRSRAAPARRGCCTNLHAHNTTRLPAQIAEC